MYHFESLTMLLNVGKMIPRGKNKESNDHWFDLCNLLY